MYSFPLKGICLSLAVILLVLYSICGANAQEVLVKSCPMSLSEAISMAKRQNKWVQVARTQAKATKADLKDAYSAALPMVNASTTYQRFSDLTLYTDGLANSTTGQRKPTPNAANLGFDATFNIYSGGRQKALQEEQESRMRLAEINTSDQSGFYGLQTATQYLNLVQLAELRKFILDQLKRAETR
ncbi:Outer membrane efflux protein [Pedobacter westerhofensis]|uniref:Outer membrane efflux protein n=1 Tax=Pedobacter westerhofensis TaxID=425512 RepID=A0A521FL17_9SPHI|nr:Outer membrane efflux protein [Pedobacter westerhofensis]